MGWNFPESFDLQKFLSTSTCTCTCNCADLGAWHNLQVQKNFKECLNKDFGKFPLEYYTIFRNRSRYLMCHNSEALGQTEEQVAIQTVV